MTLKKLAEIADALDQLGYFSEANQITEILETAVIAAKTAAAPVKWKGPAILLSIVPNAPQNEWAGSVHLIDQNGNVGQAIESFSSPIYQNPAAKTAPEYDKGVAAVKAMAVAQGNDFRVRNPKFKNLQVHIDQSQLNSLRPAATPAQAPVEFTMGPATVR